MGAPALRALAAALLLASCGLTKHETYDATGRVQEIDTEKRVLLIAHDEIPGFMPAMTMSFNVARELPLDALEPGQPVRFVLERSGTDLRITALETTGGPAGHSGTLRTRAVAALEHAPGFALVDHDGAPFALADVAGKAVLLDFIFTRCPGPCPLLTAAHAEAQRQLPEAVRARTAFVSISLDPEHDTPARLRAYATERGADLDHWRFLTGEPAAVRDVVSAYHVGTLRQPDGQLDHIVVTYLIAPDGRIADRHFGTDTPPADLARALTALAGAG